MIDDKINGWTIKFLHACWWITSIQADIPK